MAGLGLNTNIISKLAGRISYLNARHDVMVQNIANMETPNYKAKDIEFKGYLDEFQKTGQGEENTSVYKPDVEEIFLQDDPKPNGNNVSMEEQMAKMADNSVEFMVATEVIKKNLALLKFSTSE